MQRRDFLTSAAALGLCLSASPSPAALARSEQGKGLAGGGKLTPPQNGLIPVAVAISRGTTDIDWVGPMAVFDSWRYDPVAKQYVPSFKQMLVAETLEPVSGYVPDYTFETAPAPKVVIVPAQRGSAALVEWLRKVCEPADVVMSVCIGARHLARAGLLDGKQATTHHQSIEQFAKDYPKVKWVRGVRFVEGPKISTGGGLTAGIDLGLRVFERYFGREEALKAADHLEYQGRGWII